MHVYRNAFSMLYNEYQLICTQLRRSRTIMISEKFFLVHKIGFIEYSDVPEWNAVCVGAAKAF